MPKPTHLTGGLRTWSPAAAMLAIACVACEQSPEPAGEPASASCADAAVRDVVTGFGSRLQRVSTLAPDSLIARAVRDEYAAFVTDDLLAQWTAAPARAPGRDVSSPWPDRIEVHDVETAGDACIVSGELVYVASVESGTDAAADRRPLTLRVVRAAGEWRIGGYEIPEAGRPVTSADSAVAVLGEYFEALEARDGDAADTHWIEDGRDEFAGALETMTELSVEIGEPGRIEGAAGSRYIAIPVQVRITGSGGDTRRFSGTYTLRRSVVDGATAAQMRWRIHAADLAEH